MHLILRSVRCLPVVAVCALALFLGYVPNMVMAHQPNVIGTPDQHAVIAIDKPEISQALYGELINHPHMYEIVADTPFVLYAQILVPHIKSAQDNVSGIILRVLENGSVEEVARLHAKDAAWDSFYEPFGGDSYREGPVFEDEVPAGTYRIEVSTPDNIGKYVLAVGKEENFEGVGYLDAVREIARVKVFFGKSQFAVVESPFVYVPLLIVIGLLVLGRYIWLKRNAL